MSYISFQAECGFNKNEIILAYIKSIYVNCKQMINLLVYGISHSNILCYALNTILKRLSR
jgi:hypothetical protein